MSDLEIKNKTIAMRNGEISMKRDREFWSDEERMNAALRYAAGVPLNEIAIDLERSEGAVYQQIVQMKLNFIPPEKARKRHSEPRASTCLCSSCTCDRSLCPLCEVYRTQKEE